MVIKKKMPKDLRYDLGETLGQVSLKLLRWIVIANALRDKASTLQNLQIDIHYLQVLLRLTNELRGISHGEFKMLSEILLSIAEQNKKWLSWARQQPLKVDAPRGSTKASVASKMT